MSFTNIGQLGEKGKDGTTYLVKKRGREYAMKTFKKNRNQEKIQNEYNLQKKAGKAKISPIPYSVDLEKKFILMQKMDSHFFDEINEKKGVITQKRQKRILYILKKLDEIGVYHNDCNITNWMVKDGELYIIDFGFSKAITPSLLKRLKTETPNQVNMLIGVVITLKEVNVPEKSYRILLGKISKENREKYGL